MRNRRTGEQGISSYELFIGPLSVLSIINLVLVLLPKGFTPVARSRPVRLC